MTKAERFQIAQQRAAHARNGIEPGHASAGKRARARGRIKDRVPNPASHNEHAGAPPYGWYEYEVSATTRPSRKSSRKSPARIKTDSPLRLRTMNRNATPQQRSSRRTRNAKPK